jgi:hypothetical protein
MFFVINCSFIYGQTSDSYKIKSLKAYLYYNQLGMLSDNIIDNPKIDLSDVFLGNSTLKSPANSFMIVVEIAGKPLLLKSDRKIKVTATTISKKKKVFEKIQTTNQISNSGKYYESFLMDVWCEPLLIKVQILGQKEKEEIEKTLSFECNGR